MLRVRCELQCHGMDRIHGSTYLIPLMKCSHTEVIVLAGTSRKESDHLVAYIITILKYQFGPA